MRIIKLIWKRLKKQLMIRLCALLVLTPTTLMEFLMILKVWRKLHIRGMCSFTLMPVQEGSSSLSLIEQTAISALRGSARFQLTTTNTGNPQKEPQFYCSNQKKSDLCHFTNVQNGPGGCTRRPPLPEAGVPSKWLELGWQLC